MVTQAMSLSDILNIDQNTQNEINSFDSLCLVDLEWLLILGKHKEGKQVLEKIQKHIESSSSVTLKDTSAILITFLDNLFLGNFESILTHQYSENLIKQLPFASFNSSFSDCCELLTEYLKHLKSCIAKEIGVNNNIESSLLNLCIGIAFLNLFIQVGWTGPNSELDIFTLLPDLFLSFDCKVINKTVLDHFTVDGEEAYHLATKPLLLWFAEAFFDTLSSNGKSSVKTSSWWLSRSLFIKQRILDNPTGTIQARLETLMSKTYTILPNEEKYKNITGVFSGLPIKNIQELYGRFSIELGLQYHFFYNDREAVKKFTKAQEITGLQWKLTGALGKRTKFQQFDITQLVLWAKSQTDEDTETSTSEEVFTAPMPKKFDLNDDVLLENLSFTEVHSDGNPSEEDILKQTPLKPADQCILLAFCLNIKNTNPSHGLTTEQMTPYVTRVLENPGNWMVYTMALLLRSRLESHKSRTVERSLFQLEALVQQFGLTDSTVTERLEHFHSLLLPSKWEMEKELAKRFMSLGAIRSAIEIYLKLEMWEELVQSYLEIEEKEKALEVVNAQLSSYPDSPKLLCLKGDVLSDPFWWSKAWEISGNRYARAMRALGSFHFRNEQFSLSLECYKKALKINPLFENSWFACGCAAMRVEDWETSKTAFQKVVTLDPENGEAWCNLSSSFARLGSKSESFFALQMAIRQNYGSWKIWTNFLFLSIDLAKFSDAITAFERVLDLRWESQKEKCVDKEILSILITVISTDAEDFSGQGAGRLRPKLHNLIQNITNKIAGDPGIWHLAAKFYSSSKDRDLESALDCYIKAYRCSLNHPDLLISHDAFSTCATAALELIDAYSNYGSLPSLSNNNELICKDWHYQCRILLRSLINRTRDSFETDPEHDLLVNALNSLNESK